MLMFDRLANFISGLGTSKDKTIANAYALTTITQPELEAAYRSDWLARKIIDLPPFDMTREWRDWQAEEDQIEKIEAVEKALRVRDKVACGLQRGRLYGGAAIYMGIKGQNPSEELSIESVSKDHLEYLHVLSRWELTAAEINKDPISPTFGEPTYYEVKSGNGTQARIHPSRVIRFIGAPLPDPFLAGTDGWGDPVLQVVYDAVQNAASSAEHIAALIPEARVDVVGVPGLSGHLSTAEGTSRITARFRAANQIKSMFHMFLLERDGETGETYEQKSIDFTQFPDLIRMYLQIASGAADIPVTRLLGQSPAGLNATGESDIRNYYDHLASKQEVELRPRLDRLDEVLIRSALGTRPPDVYYEFAPLWQMSEKEKADVGKIEAETDQIYSSGALVPAPVLETAIRNRLIENGRYPGIEKAYDDFDAGTLEPLIDPEELVDPDAPEVQPSGNAPSLAKAKRGKPKPQANRPDAGA